MNIFQNRNDEERLCQVLKAYVEEWGPASVIVCVPKHWDDFGITNLGGVRLEFVTENAVLIRVVEGEVQIKFEVQLKVA